jgi:K+-transporting ATPase c subunit
VSDATAVSGGSNQGTFSPELLDTINQRRQQIAAREGVPEAAVPADAVTASGSGLDPDISPAYAALQVPRVARVTGLPVDRGAGARRAGHRRAGARLPRRADGQRHRAEPRRGQE